MQEQSPIWDFVISRRGRLAVFVGMIGSTIWIIGFFFKHQWRSRYFRDEDWAWLIVGALGAFIWFGLLALAGSWALRASSAKNGDAPLAKPAQRDEGE